MDTTIVRIYIYIYFFSYHLKVWLSAKLANRNNAPEFLFDVRV